MLFACLSSAFGQVTVPVIDQNLKNALCSKYSTVMTTACTLLDTIKAEKLEGNLKLSNLGLTNVTEIKYFNRIDTINVSNNQLTSFFTKVQPASFWSLDYLDLSNNQITTFPTLSIPLNYKTIRYIYFQNNKATTFQNLWDALDTVEVIDVSGNEIAVMPDMSRARNADMINISNNYLSFDDIIPQTKHAKFATVFTVFPQKKLKWNTTQIDAVEQKAYSLQLNFDNAVTTNTYQWYKNDVLVKTTTKNSLTFDTLKLSDAGMYKVVVKNSNPLLQGGVLETEEIFLNVTNCMDASGFRFNREFTCYGAEFVLDSLSVVGGVSPYTFTLKGLNNLYIQQHQAVKLLTDSYQVSVVDATGCKKIVQDKINIQALSDCDHNVITPNGDGIQDEMYLTGNGHAYIYNKTGVIIKELTLPSFWDARDTNYNIVPPGKYVMVVEGGKQVTLKVVW